MSSSSITGFGAVLLIPVRIILEPVSGKVWMNHLPAPESYWIGWPASPGFLSETRLIILNLSVVLATVSMNMGSANSAFVFDEAILISNAARSLSWVLVIAK